MSPQFTLVEASNGESFVTVFVPGRDPLSAGNTHPNFDTIKARLLDDDYDEGELVELFDVEQAVATKFRTLSERVSVGNGRVYLDGDEQDGAIVDQIVRFLGEGVGDWWPLVGFMEKVTTNPNEHSRTQLYDWLKAHNFTITQSGDVIGYKGVTKNIDGSLVSGWKGRATVNGEVIEGRIPNAVNSVIEMPRSEVQHDPAVACSQGLHVGTFEYAKGYANGAMLKVAVNPRDVVSVPTDAAGEKVRVCRYRVLKVIDAPVSGAYDDGGTPLEDLSDERYH